MENLCFKHPITRSLECQELLKVFIFFLVFKGTLFSKAITGKNPNDHQQSGQGNCCTLLRWNSTQQNKQKKPTKFYSRTLQNGCQTVKRTGLMILFNNKVSKVQTNLQHQKSEQWLPWAWGLGRRYFLKDSDKISAILHQDKPGVIVQSRAWRRPRQFPRAGKGLNSQDHHVLCV